jgi:hypothetical protein
LACSPAFSSSLHSTASQGKDLLESLRSQNFGPAGKLLINDTGMPSLEVHLQDCDGCPGSDSRVTVLRYDTNARGKLTTRQVVGGMISPLQTEELLRVVAEKPQMEQVMADKET